jgi:hypothetical protein
MQNDGEKRGCMAEYNEDEHAEWSLLNDQIKTYQGLSEKFDKLDPKGERLLSAISEYLFDSGCWSTSFLEALLSEANKEKQFANGEIVKYLMDHGQQAMTLQDGTKIALKSEVSIQYPGENDEEKDQSKQKLYTWIAEQGEGNHIKDVVKFAAGSADEVLFESLKEGGYSFTHGRVIHPQTLAKLMRDRVENGEPLPPIEIAEIKPFIRATIK